MTRVAWPASLVLGLALMLIFEAALTRVLGLLCLAAFIVLGVIVIARPDFVEGDAPPRDARAARGDRPGGAA